MYNALAGVALIYTIIYNQSVWCDSTHICVLHIVSLDLLRAFIDRFTINSLFNMFAAIFVASEGMVQRLYSLFERSNKNTSFCTGTCI